MKARYIADVTGIRQSNGFDEGNIVHVTLYYKHKLMSYDINATLSVYKNDIKGLKIGDKATVTVTW